MDWDPTYITEQDQANYSAGHVVTADEYNGWINLLAYQGNNNTAGVYGLLSEVGGVDTRLGIVELGLENKVDKVTGKGLSTNDYTTAEKTKLASIVSGAEANVQSNWTISDTTSDAYIENKPAITSGTGTNSILESSATESSGNYSHAEGYQTTASARAAHAEGYKTTASGVQSHAEGCDTTASSVCSHAEGYRTTASMPHTHAEGNGTTASGQYAHTEGKDTTTSGLASHAEGAFGTASGDQSHVEGASTSATGLRAHAEGYKTTASGSNSHAQNYYTVAASKHQTALGKYNIEDAHETYAVIVGNGTADDSRSNALTVDWSGNVVASGTVTDGNGVSFSDKVDKVVGKGLSTNDYTTAEKTKLASIASSAEGVSIKSNWVEDDTTSGAYVENKPAITSGTGTNSILESSATEASGDYSHAEGQETTASNLGAHAEGGNTTASGYTAHSEGAGTTASGNYSHAEGAGTTASGNNSHAEGGETTASDDFSHAEGFGTVASGEKSHAEGWSNTASGEASHVEGWSNTASGICSHAGGTEAGAYGDTSFSHGYATVANQNNQVVFGEYNDYEATPAGNLTHYVFVIGNGTADNSRSNAFAVDNYGLTYINGHSECIGSLAEHSGSVKIAASDTYYTVVELTFSEGGMFVIVGDYSFSYNRTTSGNVFMSVQLYNTTQSRVLQATNVDSYIKHTIPLSVATVANVNAGDVICVRVSASTAFSDTGTGHIKAMRIA